MTSSTENVSSENTSVVVDAQTAHFSLLLQNWNLGE